jgi:hypothetical protein
MPAHNIISDVVEGNTTFGLVVGIGPSPASSGYSKGAIWINTADGFTYVNHGTNLVSSWSRLN